MHLFNYLFFFPRYMHSTLLCEEQARLVLPMNAKYVSQWHCERAGYYITLHIVQSVCSLSALFKTTVTSLLDFFFIVAQCCCSWGICMLPHLFMVPCICKTINVGRCLVPYRADLFLHVRIRPILSCSEMGVLPKLRDRGEQMQLKWRWESGRHGDRMQSGAPLQEDNSSSSSFWAVGFMSLL